MARPLVMPFVVGTHQSSQNQKKYQKAKPKQSLAETTHIFPFQPAISTFTAFPISKTSPQNHFLNHIHNLLSCYPSYVPFPQALASNSVHSEHRKKKLLGKGSHGCVYKAVLRGRLVAVKKPSRGSGAGVSPRVASSSSSTNEVENEIEILSKIQSQGCFGILLLEIISGRKAIDVGHSPPSIVDWAIPLIRKGKLLAIYDPTIAPPKEPFVRKQLAVVAAKCVRSCRERRPSMKEVVEWLGGLSKLVPLHTWNGFNNPCLMVETMGCPVEASKMDGVEGGNMDGMDAKFGRTPLRNSRRVYSDLGSGTI
ncbi:Serine/threonine-protein kinase-like protein [Vitis vinifera]|uniref:Serine/threonine-protein kinase-like protein n=1 Tax=Vitis vinifera TaxID=29760 RepID=A0A438C9Z4_VITVI|nr:Serine/threonine-protein kinase-like protein [Vitis vinifera]